MPDATALADAVRQSRISASALARAAIANIGTLDPALNAFTAVFAETAMADAAEIDRKIARGVDPGPLAGVPFAVKNLYDVAGVTTLAGSAVLRDAPPAARDATVVARLKTAGAVLVGANNMDEFAYGFTTQNAHYGPTHNPHDLDRSAGGSSGGSAAAVAAGIVPVSLGTDTNGSIRVPAGFCGIFGLKPTFRRLSRTGVYPFVHELDHVGPFARSVRDLALVYDLLQGPDADDPHLLGPVEPTLPGLETTVAGIRVGVLGGWFRESAEPVVLEAVDRVAAALAGGRTVTLPGVAEARAAAFCITAASGGAMRLDDLRKRPEALDPATRDRFFAGALLPASVLHKARRVRLAFRDRLRAVFEDCDILLAPVAPCPAPRLDQTTLTIGGHAVPLRPNIGIYTQPLSFAGPPIVTVPVDIPGQMPIGVQIVGAPWREDLVLRVAAMLERMGVAHVRPPAHVADAAG
ncbi:MAG TPA: AtzE family amidohydrolase [Alphaproteobacteria bacterium]|jgi:AtzE family amidohydrolase|nr:AtzE family amidohydrolase [Alphaproteobacteria bacterium]